MAEDFRTVDGLTGEVNVLQKPLNLEGLEELLDGDLLLNGFLEWDWRVKKNWSNWSDLLQRMAACVCTWKPLSTAALKYGILLRIALCAFHWRPPQMTVKSECFPVLRSLVDRQNSSRNSRECFERLKSKRTKDLTGTGEVRHLGHRHDRFWWPCQMKLPNSSREGVVEVG